MAKATGHMPPKKASKKKVARIRIEPGQNGSVMVHHMEHADVTRKPGGGSIMVGRVPEKSQGFSTPDEAQDHVNGLMGQLAPPPDGSANEIY